MHEGARLRLGHIFRRTGARSSWPQTTERSPVRLRVSSRLWSLSVSVRKGVPMRSWLTRASCVLA